MCTPIPNHEDMNMRVAFFDCFAGASGDMILGSLLDAGLDVAWLRGELAKLHLNHFHLDVKKVLRNGLAASQAVVVVDPAYHKHQHRHLKEIRDIIEGSDLDPLHKDQSLSVFTRLAQAESKVHGTTVDQIHFHEVGAVDAIVDIVGSVVGLSGLGVERLYCSPLNVGSGFVECEHGTLPIPSPATAELIKGIPVYSTGSNGEFLTPTGAAILSVLTSQFGAMPAMVPDRIGCGAGTAERSIPNLLRVIIGDASREAEYHQQTSLAVVETTIDDMNPQIYEYVMERIFVAGAVDVFLIPVQMKKNRPGVLLTVVCPVDRVREVATELMRETTTIGLRWRVDNGIKALHSLTDVRTTYGVVKAKAAMYGGQIVNLAPEYEDCKRLAIQQNIPLKEVMEKARIAAWTAIQKKGE